MSTPPLKGDFVTPLVGDFATLGDAMDAAAEQLRDREAYVEGELRATFGEWLPAADAVALDLVERGVQPGDVVALMLPPSIDFAIAVAAIVKAGAVATALNSRLGSREVTSILERCSPVLVIRDETLELPSIPPGVPVLARTDLVTDGPGLGRRRPARNSEDPVVIIWTSGTTGLPKGAWFDHRALEAAVGTAGVMAAPFDRRLVPTPFAHAGYLAKLWEQLAWGISVVVGVQPWTPEAMLRQLAEERVTVAGGVPTQWSKLVELPDLDGHDLSSLRLCLSATAPAPPELVERMTDRLGAPVVVRYAMTESPSITGTEPGDGPDVLFRTVGRPQTGVEVELRDRDGEVGTVHIRSTCAMRGYWHDDEATDAAFTSDGWLRSSDLGRFDDRGNLVLVGRAGDMYIRGGYNVHPLEVEHVLAEHPGVAQAAVIGAGRPVIGEIGVAFVVPVDRSAPPSFDELREWCSRQLADYKAPDEVVIIDALPLTPMLKVDKDALRDRLTPG